MSAPREAEQNVSVLFRPVVWLLAVLLLPLRAVGRAGDRFLESYERGADAAWQLCLRGAQALGRGVVRVLGPLGRLLRRVLIPAWRLVVRVWDRAGLWLTLRVIRPMGRFARRVAARCRPVADRLTAWGRSLAARLDPLFEAVERSVLAVDRATERLAARLRSVWAPVRRAAAALSARRASSG